MRIVLALALVFLFLSGCKSQTAKISNASMEIRTIAESSRQRFDVLNSPEGVAEQRRIVVLTGEIQSAIPFVADSKPTFARSVELAAMAAACIAGAVLVWQLGLGTLTRRLFSWVPQRKQQAAKLLHESLHSESNTSMREAVAAMRALDPDLDLAFRQQHAHPR
jgi:hypothetical protein